MSISNKLWLHILIGMAAGGVLGFALSPSGLGLVAEATALTVGSWLAVIGFIFLGLIGMVIIPLVVCSIILGINSSHDAGFVKRIGLRLIPYFVITTFIAVTIGITLTTIIQPGQLTDAQSMAVAAEPRSPHRHHSRDRIRIRRRTRQ